MLVPEDIPSSTMLNLLQEWGWAPVDRMPIAAYVHVPFCRHRCGYCNFSLMANRQDLFDRYLNAIEIELSGLVEPRSVRTLFLGGGTPSILPIPQLEQLLHRLREWLPPSASAMHYDEWSIEANPLDIDSAFCEACVASGVKRISIGGQSFQDTKLKQLERDHTPQQLADAITIAKQYFDSVSLDLIFAAPGESLDGWMHDLDQTISLGVDHVSTYGLTYEKGAKFWSLREKGELQSATEDDELQMYLTAIRTLASAGYQHYEVSNFAKDGHQCLHNQAYWNGEPWWAFGPSAARFVGNVRSVNHRGTIEYLKRLENGRSPVVEHETLSPDQKLRERFVFGMRRIEGVEWDLLKMEGPAETVESIDQAVEDHLHRGWLQRIGSRIALTQEGLVISDSLWSEYL